MSNTDDAVERLSLPDSILTISSTENAAAIYCEVGLKPLLLHAPTETGGCSCGKVHDKTASGGSSTGKHPIQQNWQKKELTYDELRDQIARTRFVPNIGLILGKQPNGEYLIAIDVDDAERIVVLEQELGPLPATPRCDSGRGYRLFFSAPPEVDPEMLQNTTAISPSATIAKDKLPGVDAKVERGQVVVAPSLHGNGKRYVWTVAGPIAPLPVHWALQLVKKPEIPKFVQKYTPAEMSRPGTARKRAERYLEVAVVREANALASCGQGNRNNTLYAVACRMFELCGGLHQSHQWQWVHDELLRSGKTCGLTDHEVRATLASSERRVRETGKTKVPMVLANPAPSNRPGPISVAPDSSPTATWETVPTPISSADDPWTLSSDDPGSKLPVIEVTTALKANANLAIAALREDKNLYQRDGKLVFVTCVDKEEKGNPLAVGSPQIREMTRPLLKGNLSEIAIFKKWIESQGGLKRVIPPDDIVANVFDRTEWDGIRRIVGITENPMLRPNGSIVQNPGYDSETCWLYVPSDKFPEIKDADATQFNAQWAFRFLSDVFVDFPYSEESHQSVPIAALLSLLARPAILGSVPAFLFDASTRGSGKTLHIDVISTLATGRHAPRMNYTSDEVELEKILAGYALKGVPFFCLDNVPAMRPFGGGPIDRVITARDTVDLRVLGSNDVPTVIWRAIIMATGNNMTLFGETARRVVMARLEPKEENPERRTSFKRDDLLAYVRKERPRLIAAAMLILRAYFLAGCPDMGCPRWGSFEEWNKIVPHAIVFAGGHDPMKARPSADEDVDQETRAVSCLLQRIHQLWGEEPFRLSAFIELLYIQPPVGLDPGNIKDPEEYGSIKDAVEVLAPRRGRAHPDATQLGKKLGAVARDRVIKGYRLVSRTGHGGAQKWQVTRVTNDANTFSAE